MGFNVYLGPLVQVDGATSISTVSLVDVEIGSFSPYIFVPTPWTKHTKTNVTRAPSLKNPSCSKLDFSPPSPVVAVAAAAAALLSPVLYLILINNPIVHVILAMSAPSPQAHLVWSWIPPAASCLAKTTAPPAAPSPAPLKPILEA